MKLGARAVSGYRIGKATGQSRVRILVRHAGTAILAFFQRKVQDRSDRSVGLLQRDAALADVAIVRILSLMVLSQEMVHK